jgi:hypothetical protein
MLPTVRCLTVGRGADVLVPEARLVQNHLYAAVRRRHLELGCAMLTACTTSLHGLSLQ